MLNIESPIILYMEKQIYIYNYILQSIGFSNFLLDFMIIILRVQVFVSAVWFNRQTLIISFNNVYVNLVN